MRFLVFSDSHGKTDRLKKILELHNDSDAVIFLGDGCENAKKIISAFNKPYYIVRGNCDIGSNEKDTDFINYNGHKIMLCHGHRYSVKYGIDRLTASARANNCDVVLFGHTHIPFTKYDDGLYILNPGSISVSPTPSYGILDITEKGIMVTTTNVH